MKRLYMMLLLGGVACGSSSTTPFVCDAALHAAIRLRVHDARTGASIASQATIVATLHGGAPETIVHPRDSVVAIGEAAGTYDLSVSAPDFLGWSARDVLVLGENGLGCQPIAVPLDARLQAAP